MALLGIGAQAAPAATAVQQEDNGETVFQMGPGVTPPRVTHQVQPDHPSRGFRITGTVLIGLVVGSSGEPREIKVLQSLDKDVDQAAARAVSQWRFDPAKKDGKPVAVRISVEIRFHDM